MLRIALIGAGNHCRGNHAPSLRHYVQEHPGTAELAAVCDLDAEKAERAREEFGFRRAFTDIDAMFDAVELDAVVAIVPIPAILPVARRLFPRRVPCVIEKPLGSDLDEARAIVAAAEETGCPVMVSMNRRFDPAVLLALEWLGDKGPVRAIHGSLMRHNRTEAFFQWGTALHLLDLMAAIVGPLRLRAGAAPAIRGGGSRLAVLDGDDGLVGTVGILPCSGRLEEWVRIAGDDYCVDIWTGTPHPWRIEAWHANHLELCEQCPDGEPPFIRCGAYNETAAFLEAVARGGLLPAPSPLDVMPAGELAARLEEVG